MRAIGVLSLTGVLPKEVANLVRGSRRWMWLLFGTAALVGIVEAATLTNLLFLGYALLGEEPSGPLGGLLGDQCRLPLGQYENARRQPQRLGDAGQESEQCQSLMP